jgi:hypothetical protein
MVAVPKLQFWNKLNEPSRKAAAIFALKASGGNPPAGGRVETA